MTCLPATSLHQNLGDKSEIVEPAQGGRSMETPYGSIRIHHHLDWPYDEAIAWMKRARASVLEGGEMEIAIGSHSQEIVTLGAHTPDAQIYQPDMLRDRGAIIRRVERGGGATCHEPGQIVLYPIVSLSRLGMSVPGFTDLLISTTCQFLSKFGIEARGSDSEPGVYVEDQKIASLGFRSRRGVITHGLAINYTNQMALFQAIHPCGVTAQEMASVLSITRAMGVETRCKPLPVAMKMLETTFQELCVIASAM